MEETPVVIVGAGPAGLTLALSLAKFAVKVSTVDVDKKIRILIY